MKIQRIKIRNFKGFHDIFSLPLNTGINLIVGDNEAGKSTILEAIHLALTGLYQGRSAQTDISPYLFNEQSVSNFLEALRQGKKAELPSLEIELFLEETKETAAFCGDGNSEKADHCGLSIKVEFNEEHRDSYAELLKANEIKTLPIEYYHFIWKSFARKTITSRNIPTKCALIDSSTTRNYNGSDVYIGRVIRDLLSNEELVSLSQSHRQMKEGFMDSPSIEILNKKIKDQNISDKPIKIAIDLSNRVSWESSLTTYLSNVPFHQIGKGEQCLVKTRLALSHNKAAEANLILIEEPENHLSHSTLNSLLSTIKQHTNGKQIIITTHSSFVANKLGLNDLIFLNNKNIVKLSKLDESTQEFFEKIAGYDTLRLILCKKAILVEGDSDELIVQRAYMDNNQGKLPIADGIEVISVGISFLRFLEIADNLKKEVCVLTDSDGDVDALKKKYLKYDSHEKKYIKICYDPIVDAGALKMKETPFNYNTLEPKLVKANGKNVIEKILGKQFNSVDELHLHMKANKTDCALKIFKSNEKIIFPDYILNAIAK
jgi:putative ATP-dependent endonuclease of OLD family